MLSSAKMNDVMLCTFDLPPVLDTAYPITGSSDSAFGSTGALQPSSPNPMGPLETQEDRQACVSCSSIVFARTMERLSSVFGIRQRRDVYS
jgi:hypothetical protein